MALISLLLQSNKRLQEKENSDGPEKIAVLFKDAK